jgi:hypothetical protein
MAAHVSTRSPYQLAIDRTQRTIDARAAAYRNLVVVVTVVLIGPIAAALLLRSWLPLVGMGALALLYCVFVIHDSRLVLGWQREMLRLWTEQQVDLKPLHDALNAVPQMPKRTLHGMLTMLPAPAAPEVLVPSMLRVVAFVAHETHAARHLQALLTATGRLIAIFSLLYAAALGSLLPLLGLSAVPLLVAVGAARNAIVRRRWRAEIAAARTAGVDYRELRDRVQALHRAERSTASRKRPLFLLHLPEDSTATDGKGWSTQRGVDA